MKKRQIALNKFFNFCLVLGSLLCWGGINLLCNGETAWGIGVSAAGVLCIVSVAIFTPFCYSFDSEGVSLCYVFFPTERYLWKDIHAVTVESIKIGAKATIFDFFYEWVFHLKGKTVGKSRFYMSGNIRKSFRTKYLLQKYWDGTITGYLFEDVKKWYNKRKTKKQTQIEMHYTDEVVVKEREIRADVRKWIQPFTDEAKQLGLEIKTEFLYITSDFEEWKSRPREGYTYTVVGTIARFNETDEDRMVVFSVDLLYTRLGKTAYRGVCNEHANEELQVTLSDTFGEIKQHGFEAYCE